jgi:hypothetical protein
MNKTYFISFLIILKMYVIAKGDETVTIENNTEECHICYQLYPRVNGNPLIKLHRTEDHRICENCFKTYFLDLGNDLCPFCRQLIDQRLLNQPSSRYGIFNLLANLCDYFYPPDIHAIYQDMYSIYQGI